jgi:glucose/arabinose dehydrogenase
MVGLVGILPAAIAVALAGTDVAAAGAPTPTPTATPARMALPRRIAAPGVTASGTVRPAAPAAMVTLDPLPGPIVVGATLNLTGSGFTPGSVVVLFVSTGNGAQTYGPLAPSAASATALSVPIPASIGLGNGFATLEVVNTDQGFIASNLRSQYLFGSPASNLPTVTAINGVGLEPPDPSVPLNSVATVIAQGSTITVAGTGFNNPRVALFSSNPNAANLVPLAGGTSTQVQVVVPMSIPTGPGALQVVNDPYVGNVLSNTVSVPIGEQVRIDSISQNGSTVTVTGAGFSSRTVISLFNLQGNTVVNLGGLVNGTQSLIPLTIISSNLLTFQIPSGAVSGPSYVQALNPPFIPFTSSGDTPNGALDLVVPNVARGGSSLHFFGNGSGDIDRVKIKLDAPARPIDVGGDFTLEFWMKSDSGNASGTCTGGGDTWINGNTIFDRDVFGTGDFGDYGISLFGNGGRLAFGVNRLGTGTTICGATNVADGAWHHVAVTRSTSTGLLRLFVDGHLDASGSGPSGDVSYRDGRPTNFPNSDPYLVIGAEKHDIGPAFPSYHGWIDEVRISTVVRYTGSFTRPSVPFTPDANTVGLYHFDEDNGNTVVDDSGAAGGPSNGVRRFGGSPPGPQWSTDTPFATATPSIALSTLTTALTAPTSITHAGDGRLFITEQAGTVRIWDGTKVLPNPFLTVSPISSGGERGLLSVAFHPHYAQNGFFFVYYTDPSGNVAIARYRVSADPNVADPTSGVVLLTIPHPATNHNGGQLQFGPDGYLYAGIGDGGGGCDSAGAGCNAQRDNLLLGKMLRVDVDQNVNTAPFYGIPPTNPFVGPGDPRDEIWAKGLRNPFRFSFDHLTGGLLIGDVGQDSREEVDYQPSDSGGGENYGWKRMEGFLCNTCDLSNCPTVPPPCNDPSLTLPILDYPHNPECAIIGGYVYRGSQVPFLYGKYIYGDLCSGRLWWAVQDNGSWTAMPFTPTAPNVYSFGQDVNGELYLARGDGTVARVSPGP